MIADSSGHRIGAQGSRGESAYPFVSTVTVLRLISGTDNKAYIIVIVQSCSENFLPCIRFITNFGACFIFSAYLYIADVKNLKLISGKSSVFLRSTEFAVASVCIIVNGIFFKTGDCYLINTLSRIAVDNRFACEFFKFMHITAFADTNNPGYCAAV